jgi:Domain of unknown function (DUF4177)
VLTTIRPWLVRSLVVVACASAVALTSATGERHAASVPVTYKAVPLNPNQLSAQGNTTQALQELLNKNGAEGWQLVAVEPATGHLIFRK